MPILQSSGANFDLAFCPERTLEGKALQELRQLPQIIGEATPGASVRASQLFQFITPTTVRVTDAETAEMIKLIDNAQRDMLFAYANEIARLCDAIGISAREVIEAGKLGYSRTNLPMPGPVGGPCLEKDSYILAEKMLEIGIRPEITLAARKINERQPEEIIAYLKKLSGNISGFPEHPVITLMGIAFKGQPPTDDLRGSMAKPIFKALQKYFPASEYRGFDAVVPEKQIKNLGLKPYTNLEQAILGSNLVDPSRRQEAGLSRAEHLYGEHLGPHGQAHRVLHERQLQVQFQAADELRVLRQCGTRAAKAAGFFGAAQ
jgi:nucleotide sugar dehydrogenase